MENEENFNKKYFSYKKVSQLLIMKMLMKNNIREKIVNITCIWFLVRITSSNGKYNLEDSREERTNIIFDNLT